MAEQYTVYIHKNKINEKMYVGVTSMVPSRRWGAGSGYKQQPYFYHAIQKYGWENFEHIIVAQNLDKTSAERMEIELISKYQTTDANKGYNIQNGGFLAGKHSEGTKKLLSENHKGLMAGESHPMYGKHHTEESRKKISEAQYKPVYQYDRYTGIFIAEYCSTIETEAKLGIPNSNISSVCLGKMKTAHGYVFRYASKDILYGEPLSKEELKKINKNDSCTSVIQMDKDGNYIAQYGSISEAISSTGASNSGIIACCHGRGKTSGGWAWKYAS